MYQYVNPKLSYILVLYACHLAYIPLIKWKPKSYSPAAKYCVRRVWRLWYLELKITYLLSRRQNPAYAAHVNYHVVLITYLKSASGYYMYILYIHITIWRHWLKEKQLDMSSIDICFSLVSLVSINSKWKADVIYVQGWVLWTMVKKKAYQMQQ